jgi:hypothetical protein
MLIIEFFIYFSNHLYLLSFNRKLLGLIHFGSIGIVKPIALDDVQGIH